jgi:small-conductance mechanosensitive channel
MVYSWFGFQEIDRFQEPQLGTCNTQLVREDTNQLITSGTNNDTRDSRYSAPHEITVCPYSTKSKTFELMWNNLLNIFEGWPFWLQDLSLVVLAILFGLIIILVITRIAQHFIRKNTKFSVTRSLVSRLGSPLKIVLPLFIVNLFLPLMHFTGSVMAFVEKLVGILLIMGIAYLLISIIYSIQDYIMYAFDLSKSDNLRERKIRTQLQFLRKLSITLVVFLAGIAILLNFESLRRLGTGLLTGVGVGGIIIGFAAQRSLSNLLAGLQIAFTQPLRIDDVLVVEGEWGRVEEITLTYVVLNIWDKRRLILPINYFIEKPFQNWTRTSAEIVGSVIIYLDYTAPIETIRKEFLRLLDQNPLWDRQVAALQVTDATERTIQVRALVSATSSGRAWDLRCIIREQLISYIQASFPESLPRNRTVGETKNIDTHLI